MRDRVSRTKTGDSKVAIAYLRVSTDADRQALGAQGQRDSIVKWATAGGVTIAEWFLEEVSGGAALDKRLVLLAAIASVAAHRAGMLVVQRLDRFSRDPLTAALAEAELLRNGASLACADGAGSGDDPTSELVRGILFNVARFEKAMIKARIKAALAVKSSRGEVTGNAPYGFRRAEKGRTIVPHPEETAIREQIRALRVSGLTLRAVAREAASRGLLNRASKPFSVPAVYAMVRDVVPPRST
jgi:DNA invertase Pin-like site-specific DNA recombinase